MLNIVKKYMMFLKKAYFYSLKSGYARANYLRKHKILAGIGENIYYHSRIYPSDPKLLKLHSNISIATGVRFLGHDRIDIVLSGMTGSRYAKTYGCIEVGDNVFIGADSIILPGVKIGSNVIIGAGAVVTKDVPSNSICGGVPAKRIGNFDDLYDKRIVELNPESDPEKLWEIFENEHK